MRTLLEFVIEKYLGPPTRSNNNGESHWPCPQCGHPRFHSMPHKPPFRDRFRCWSCDFRGYIHDFLLEFHPHENYGDRLARLDQIRQDWRRDVELVDSARGPKAGRAKLVCPKCSAQMSAEELQKMVEEEAFSPEIKKAGRELLKLWRTRRRYFTELEQFRQVFHLLQLALLMSANRGIHPAVMAAHVDFLTETRAMELEHAATCKDPNCDWMYCRMLRNGWSEERAAREGERKRHAIRLRRNKGNGSVTG